ncbi:MAG TPA: helix-turn-helix domain-containing protein [Bacteroidia bacterium]
MIKVNILVLKNALTANIADAIQVFQQVNEWLMNAEKSVMFQIELTGLQKNITINNGTFNIQCSNLYVEVNDSDLIIVPAISGHSSSSVYINKDFAPWIASMYKKGAEVASFSTGSFLVAFSGILEGKSCTTHWDYADEFRYYYPSVSLMDERLITHQDGLYSSGGGTSHWNLLIHLVERFAGREMAIRTAKYFVVDLDKNNQSAFIIFRGLKDHMDQQVLKAQNFIEQHYAEKITVDEIADKFNLTRRTFERRFKKATRHTVAEYMQRVKVEAAKKQLEIGRKTINEVMDNVGYADVQSFRDIFRRYTGMSPVEYKSKYS